MKKIFYYIGIALLVISSGCNDDFLETENLFEKSVDNFYSRPQDIEEAFAGAYHAFYVGTDNGHRNEESIIANILSDEMLGGGGPDDIDAKNMDSFIDPNMNTYHELWVQCFNGIARSNAIIENAQNADFSDYFTSDQDAEDYKNQAVGEGYFLRAFFYFRLVKFFGPVPLVLSYDAPRDVERSPIPDVYSVIASDLKQAIELMPERTIQSISTNDYGRANKWIAQGYMARVYLYYTGYMTNIENTSTTNITLLDGSVLTKDDVIAYIVDCKDNSGYGLVDDFRNLWPYAHVNESAGEVVLPWADNEGLAWVGQDGLISSIGSGNKETMFALRYAFGSWDDSEDRLHNRLCLFSGVRGNDLVPFGRGWGWGTVNPSLWNAWSDDDVRKEGSIIELGNADQGTDGYAADQGDHETGFFNKKYTIVNHGGVDGDASMFYYLYNQSSFDYMLSAANDFQLLRYADILLMHSELTETAEGIDLVRGRAGLDPIGAYTLAALKKERSHELAFEALRWFDLVRWGDVESAYNETIDVVNSGVPAKYKVNYRAETKGLLPIPETEIDLSNGVYKQNPGWE